MKFRSYWMIGLLAVAGVGCVNRAAQDQAKKTQAIVTNPKKTVSVAKAETRTVTESMEITGEVATGEDAQVGFKAPGKIVAVYVRDGDPVSAGQLLAELDGASLRIQMQQAMAQVQAARSALAQASANATVGPQKSSAAVAQAQAQLRSAKAQLQKAISGARPEERAQAEASLNAARSDFETAKRELERVQKLFEQQVVSQQRLDQAMNGFNGAQARLVQAQEQLRMQQNWTRPEDVASAREAVRQAEEAVRTAEANKRLDVLLNQGVQTAQANLQSAQAQLALVRQSMSDLQLRAPFTGRVSGKPIQLGTVVGAGTPVVRIVGGGGAYFEGEVPATSLGSIRIGDTVTVSIDGLPDRTFSGTVAATSPTASSIGRLFKARITLDTAGESVKPGMFARGQVTIRRVPNATVVPTQAIVQRGDLSVVFISKDGKAKRVEVKVGLHTDGFSQVTGSITPGDDVVIAGQNDLDDGSDIEIQAKGEEKKSVSFNFEWRYPWA